VGCCPGGVGTGNLLLIITSSVIKQQHLVQDVVRLTGMIMGWGTCNQVAKGHERMEHGEGPLFHTVSPTEKNTFFSENDKIRYIFVTMYVCRSVLLVFSGLMKCGVGIHLSTFHTVLASGDADPTCSCTSHSGNHIHSQCKPQV